jgi:hypothetical protein
VAILLGTLVRDDKIWYCGRRPNFYRWRVVGIRTEKNIQIIQQIAAVTAIKIKF